MMTRRALLAAAAAFPGEGGQDDRKTDHTPALQKAIDTEGGLRLRRGVSRITKPLILNLDRVGPAIISGDGVGTLLMDGPGPAIRVIGTHTGTADPNTVKPNVWMRQRAPIVDAVEIVGGHAEANGIQLEGTMQPTITRVVIRRALHGIVLAGRNRNVIISNCHLYENRGAGLLLDRVNLHQINIVGCHISYNRGGGIVVRRSEVRNIQIGTCDIEANQDLKGPPAANVLFDAREGSIREGAITGCTIQHGHEAPGSANVRFLGRGAADPNKVGQFVISGNALSDVAVNIHLRYARGVVVTANTFWKGYEHHLLVEGSSNILVGQNNMDRNPDYKADAARDDVVFMDCSDSAITGLHINRGRDTRPAIFLRRCRRMHLANVRILDAGRRGLVIEDDSEGQIEGGNLQPGR